MPGSELAALALAPADAWPRIRVCYDDEDAQESSESSEERVLSSWGRKRGAIGKQTTEKKPASIAACARARAL